MAGRKPAVRQMVEDIGQEELPKESSISHPASGKKRQSVALPLSSNME
nr:hypothetical protein [Bacillus infantis]